MPAKRQAPKVGCELCFTVGLITSCDQSRRAARIGCRRWHGTVCFRQAVRPSRVSCGTGLVQGKVVLIGEIFHLGDRFHGRPLIVPTLYKTLLFSILVLAFAVLEHFLKGFMHEENIGAIVGNLAAKDGADNMAKILVMFIAFIPMFAISEIGNLHGEGRLFGLFFERGATSLPDVTNAASLSQG